MKKNELKTSTKTFKYKGEGSESAKRIEAILHARNICIGWLKVFLTKEQYNGIG